MKNMLLMMAALMSAPLMFGRWMLMESTRERTGPSKTTVKATVDGKPVISYVIVDADGR